jgi:hypothetical protein
MTTEMLEHIKLYNYLVYIPLSMCNNVTIVNDKFRDTDSEYRKNIDNNFKYILNTYSKHLPNIITIYGNRDERISLLKNKIPEIF